MAAQEIKEWYTIAELAKEVGKSVQYISSQCKAGGKIAHLVRLNPGRKIGKQVNKQAIDILNGKDSTSLNKEVSTGLNSMEITENQAVLEVVKDTLEQMVKQQKTNDAHIDQMHEIVSRLQTAEDEMRQLLLLDKKHILQLEENSKYSESEKDGQNFKKRILELEQQLVAEKKNAAALKNELEELQQDLRLNIPVDIHGRPIFEKCAEVQRLIQNAKKEAENAVFEKIKRQIKDIIEAIQEGGVYLKNEEVIHMFFMFMPTVVLDEPTCAEDLVNLQDAAFKAGYNQGWNEAKPLWKKAR